MRKSLLLLLGIAMALTACKERGRSEIASVGEAAPVPAPSIPLSDVTKITVRNDTGSKMEGIEIVSEAFNFSIRQLEHGQSTAWYLPRIGGSCGLAVRFSSGGVRKEMVEAFFLPDDGMVDEVRLELYENGKMDATFRPRNQTEFTTWVLK